MTDREAELAAELAAGILERDELKEQVARLLEKNEHLQATLDDKNAPLLKAVDKIAKLCGCAQWDYAGQVVRDVEGLVEKVKRVCAENVELTHSIEEYCTELKATVDGHERDIERLHSEISRLEEKLSDWGMERIR